MANATVFSELKDYLVYFKNLSFHDQIKVAMKWSHEDWERLELSNSKFKRLVNSGRFWRVKLLGAFHECNVILTLHSEASGGFLSPQKIIEDMEAQFPDIHITGHNRFRNPRYINIDFENNDMKKFILANLKTIGTFNVYFLNWAADEDETTIRVHWLTKNITVDKILLILNMYFSARFVKTETSVYPNGKAYGCGVSTFVGRLKPGVLMDQVPHIAKISGLESLWTIPTRLPLCLRCDNVGHKAFECKLSHCRTCKKFQAKDHVCIEADAVKSYAQVLKKDHDISASDEEIEYNNDEYAMEGEFDKTSIPVLSASTDAKTSVSEVVLPKEGLSAKDLLVVSNASGLSVLPLDQSSTPSLSVAEGSFSDKLADLVLPSGAVSDSSIVAKPYEEGDTFNVVTRRNRTPKDLQNKSKNQATAAHPHTYSRTATRSTTKTENLFDSLKKLEGEGIGKVPPGNVS